MQYPCEKIANLWYLIVDADSPTVWLYQRQDGDFWAVHMFGLEERVMLASIDASFPVAELYKKTRFAAANK